MDPVTAPPAHILLQRKQADNHGGRPQANATASAFASYAFGPLDMEGGKAAGRDKPASGAATIGNPLAAHSLSWVTTAQAAGSSGSSGKGV